MKKLLLLFILISRFQSPIHAQHQANHWYFGRNAGLDFSSGSPIVASGGQTFTDEGVASISDNNGQLLFYTEGTTVWDKNHSIMPNGTGLFGSFSSSQSAIIVPKVNDPSRYYVFTVDQLGLPNGFRYSIVNMSLNAGLGSVELKNVPVLSPVCEKLTAVKHCNGKDIWIIVHRFNSSEFYAYLVTAAGINATPVISNAGRFVPSTNVEYSIGCMKTSPDGKKLVAAHDKLGVDLMDFDNVTGVISNGRSIFLPSEPYAAGRGPYGVEFSSNSKLLYLSGDYISGGEFSYVLQYNVSLPDLPSIRASKKIIYHDFAYWSAENFGTLQMAPDGKIYLAEMNQNYISVINHPDSIGASCQFVHAGLSLNQGGNTGRSMYGLPAFIQSYWWPGFTFRGACSGTQLFFDYERTSEVISVKWDFGDPASGMNNISFLDSPVHNFSTEGIFTVKLIRFLSCGNDTVSKQVQAGQLQFTLGADTLICGGTGYTLDPAPGAGNYSYLWQDNSTTPVFPAQNAGTYWVEIKNNDNGCIKRDSINLTISPNPVFSLGSDILKCEGQTQSISVAIPSATYLWNNGSTTNTQTISQPGVYWLEVSLNGCIKRDSVEVFYYPYPLVNLGADTTICETKQILLDASNPGMNFLWQDNSQNQTYTVSNAGVYWVKVSNHGCVKVDTIGIKYDLKPQFSLGNDTLICQGMQVKLQPVVQSGSDMTFLWSTGSTEKSILVKELGFYTLLLTNKCGSKYDDIFVRKGICDIYVPSAFTPNADNKNDIFRAFYGENVVKFNLQVYNKWGQLVFESADINKGWDGQFNGRLQPVGTFVWMIRYKTTTSNFEQKITGTVILIR